MEGSSGEESIHAQNSNSRLASTTQTPFNHGVDQAAKVLNRLVQSSSEACHACDQQQVFHLHLKLGGKKLTPASAIRPMAGKPAPWRSKRCASRRKARAAMASPPWSPRSNLPQERHRPGQEADRPDRHPQTGLNTGGCLSGRIRQHKAGNHSHRPERMDERALRPRRLHGTLAGIERDPLQNGTRRSGRGQSEGCPAIPFPWTTPCC